MLAGVLHGSRDIRLETVPEPEPSPGHVVLRVRRAGVCGSDVHYFSHGRCGAFVPTRPFILGHEFVAVVEHRGAGVEQLSAGDRVVINPAASCGQCEACKSGRANLCSNTRMLGSASTTPPTDGAFAEYVAVAAHQCHPLPQTLQDEAVAMVEPLSVVLHALRRDGGIAGARVLVAGAGPIGVMTVLAARALGASLIAVSEPADRRRWRALKLGADHTLDPRDDTFLEQARSISDGGFDVALEASGAPPAVRQCIASVRRGGSVVQIGTVSTNNVSLPVNDIMVREIAFLGTFRYADEFPKAIRLLAAGRIDLGDLVTATYPLSELPQAMATACDGEQSLKVQLVVGN